MAMAAFNLSGLANDQQGGEDGDFLWCYIDGLLMYACSGNDLSFSL
jgi:hypothetical protein